MYYVFISIVLSIITVAMVSPSILPNSERGLLFVFIWLYSLSHLGYIMMVGAVFTRLNFTPRTASILSTLLFFLTFFVDRAVDSFATLESKKALASLIPTVAMSRGFANIASFDKGGVGL